MEVIGVELKRTKKIKDGRKIISFFFYFMHVTREQSCFIKIKRVGYCSSLNNIPAYLLVIINIVANLSHEWTAL